MAKVLLLEDDMEFAELVVDTLLEEGHQVEVFVSATDALAAMASDDFDIIVADVFVKVDGRYVKDGGIILTSRVKQIQQKDIPVIAISGSFANPNGGPAANTIKTVGANALLAKPFHPEELLNLIYELLSKSP